MHNFYFLIYNDVCFILYFFSIKFVVRSFLYALAPWCVCVCLIGEYPLGYYCARRTK